MRLPGAEHARIEPEKIREYLLSPDHPVGRFKARFFASLGYERSRWEALRDDLLAAARSQEAVPRPDDPVRSQVRGPCYARCTASSTRLDYVGLDRAGR